MLDYKKEALILAKKSILEKFWLDSLEWYQIKNEELKKIWACFVTLKTENKTLRWCIGTIMAHREIYKDIINNAKSAAFWDPRFPALQEDELQNLYLYITILSPLEEKNFNNINDLLLNLKNNKPWLVIKLWYKSATFLPSVWEEIQNEENFLIHLLYKAQITQEEFIENFNKVEFQTYTWEEFWEEFNKI